MKKTLLFLCLALLLIPRLHAEKQIPDMLRSWQDWATWDVKEPKFPSPYNNPGQRLDFWPSALNLDVTRTGGKFDLDLTVYAESFFPLLGSSEVWPFQILANGLVIPVVPHNGVPAVHLTPGTWHLTGIYRWDEIPQRIILPREIGILNLTVEGKKIDSPAWDESGSLWLKRTPTVEPADKDFLDVKVYRLISDGIPMWLNTQVELSVSGKSREENLKTILPEGWLLSGVNGSLPATVDDQGNMKVQVRSGKWTLHVEAFRVQDAHEIRYAKDATPAVSQELIAFCAKPDFRMVEVTGVPPIDVTQTTFPQEWRRYPVYSWDGKAPFKLEERMRGMGLQKPEGLTINREFWLDDHGGKLTFLDQIVGTGQQIWRLDVAENSELGSVRSYGEGQLITYNPDTQAPGVEIRSRNINLQATGRLDLSKGLTATGWQTDADSLHVNMHLPPGWRLFAIFGGVDYVHGDWLTSWTLLDLFLLLIFSLAVYRIHGIGASVLAFFAFGLAYHEPGAPRYLWLFLLIPLALLPWVKEGWGRKFLLAWKYLIAIGLLLTLVPFLIRQLQGFLYPQLALVHAYYNQLLREPDMISLILTLTPLVLLVSVWSEIKNFRFMAKAGFVVLILLATLFLSFGILDTVGRVVFGTITETLSGTPTNNVNSFAGGNEEAMEDVQNAAQDQRAEPKSAAASASLEQADQSQVAYGAKSRELKVTYGQLSIKAKPQRIPASAPSYVLQSSSRGKTLSGYVHAGNSYNFSSQSPVGFAGAPIYMNQQQKSQNLQYDSKAKIQTGPGLPEWSWREVSFGWNSPVTASQKVHLILISLGMERLLTLLRVLLLLALVFALLDFRRVRIPGASILRLMVIGFFLMGMLPSTTQAQNSQIPDAATLQTLKNRLLELKKEELEKSLDFAGAADIPDVSLSLKNRHLSYDAEIHVADWMAVPLPGRLPSWSPVKVLVDGKSDAILSRRDGYLWAALSAGVHHVHVEGMLPEVREWEWGFQIKPRHITVDAPEWNVSGVRPGGIPEQQIFFSLKQKVVPTAEAGYEHQDYNNVAQLSRNLELGLVWQVHNVMWRLSGGGRAISLRIPLLPGEKVLSSNEIVKDGFIEVRLGAHDQSYSWDSELPVTSHLTLASRADDTWVERWRLVASPVWNVIPSGLAPVFETEGQDFVPVWNPWPGEKIDLKISRPKAVEGATVTVQHVDHSIDLSARQRNSTLGLDIECSLGEEFPITLPADVEIISLKVNGMALPVRKDGDKVIVQLHPGEQNIEMVWKTALPLGFSISADSVHLPVECTNIRTSISVPENRWVLWTHGPLIGPAVRFWVVLLVSLIAGWILGMLKFSPLRPHEWMLLAIGLTQVHLLAALVIVGWLFLLAWRGRDSCEKLSAWKFNFVQLGIIALTTISLGIMIDIVSEGLLGEPSMFILGNGSSQHYLQWYQARADGDLSQAGCVSVSIWVYRFLMLLWALWLASSLIRWLMFGWTQFGKGGFVRSLAKKSVTPPPIPQG